METLLFLIVCLLGLGLAALPFVLLWKGAHWWAFFPAKRLEKKFVGMNPLQGKTLTQIVAVVGQPKGTAQLADGRTLHKWVESPYTITLRFTGDICEGVVQETRA
jgi:hypothetical protein